MFFCNLMPAYDNKNRNSYKKSTKKIISTLIDNKNRLLKSYYHKGNVNKNHIITQQNFSSNFLLSYYIKLLIQHE